MQAQHYTCGECLLNIVIKILAEEEFITLTHLFNFWQHGVLIKDWLIKNRENSAVAGIDLLPPVVQLYAL